MTQPRTLLHLTHCQSRSKIEVVTRVLECVDRLCEDNRRRAVTELLLFDVDPDVLNEIVEQQDRDAAGVRAQVQAILDHEL